MRLMAPGSEHSAKSRALAFSVHLLTASGVFVGLLALLAAHERRFTGMFVWLGIALAIDAVDGPLARKLKVREVLPDWSGDTLDLVVDYLNYVVVPAYALVVSGILNPVLSYTAAAGIVVTSALYFADTRMKTDDAFFRGFPAVWNVVVFYLLVGKLAEPVTFAIIAVLCIMTFVPVPFLHPFRVRALRPLTLGILAGWIALAAIALAYDLSPPRYVWFGLILVALYFLSAGAFRNRSAQND
jgi:phosphatidylcholine synthase